MDLLKLHGEWSRNESSDAALVAGNHYPKKNQFLVLGHNP